MLLTGTYGRTLDEKHRFSIPKPLRDAMKECADSPMFLTPGTDGSLALYPEGVLLEIGGRLGAHSPNETDVRAFSRLFYAQAHRVDLDRQGRIRLPLELVRWANIQREIMVLGVHDHLEVWERNRWEGYLDSNQLRFDEIAEQAFKPGGYTSTEGQGSERERSQASPGGTDSRGLASERPR
jgi:MraZ protein